MAKIAVILGATGLVGSALTEELLKDSSFAIIRLVGRRYIPATDPRIEQKLIDFETEGALETALEGASVVFCAVGTTLRKVGGDMEAYRKVDFDIPVKAAKACKTLGIRCFSLVSSVGADAESSNFYLRLKGEVESAVQAVGVDSIGIFRPSMLLGKRTESRPAEQVGRWLMPIFSFLIPSKYKPISGQQVARAMLHYAKKGEKGSRVYHFQEMVRPG